MDVHIRQRLVHGGTYVQVRLSGELRVNSPLQADLGCAAFPGFNRQAGYILGGFQIGCIAGRGALFPLANAQNLQR